MTKREVRLEGGAPWGFRMNGGADSGHPLRISRVNPGSKAAQQGVREGDVISAINGTATRLLTNGDSHALLKSAGSSLTLGLNQDNTSSPKRRSRDLNKRENSAGSSQELNRLNDEHVIELEQQKSASTSSSSDPAQSKKQGKKLKLSLSRVEEEEKEENADKNECEADEGQTEEGEGKEECSVENGKKISSSKARRLRKSRAKRKIITSDHLEIIITENIGTVIETDNNFFVNDTSCDITVSNEASAIPNDKIVTLSNNEGLNSNCDIMLGNGNYDIPDEKRVSLSNNAGLNVDKEHTTLPSIETSRKSEIVTHNNCANISETNPSTFMNDTPKTESRPEKSGNIKKKSKKSKPRPLNLENVQCTSSSVTENKIENSPNIGVHLDSLETSNFETNESEGSHELNTINNEVEIKNVATANNETSQSVTEIDTVLRITQSSQDSTLVGSTVKRKKKHKSKTSKSVLVETFEQTAVVESPDKPVEIENKDERNIGKGSNVEKRSSFPVCEMNNDDEFENFGSLKKDNTNYLNSTQKHVEFIDSDEVSTRTLNQKDKSKLVESRAKKGVEGYGILRSDESEDNHKDKPENLSQTSKTSAVEFSNDVTDSKILLSKSDLHFLHIESSTSSVFNEEVDTECSKMSSLSRDEVRSPVELVLNPPTPTLASEETFFGPDWEIVEEMKSTDLVTSESDVGKKISVHDSSNSDLRAEVNDLVILDNCGDDMGLTVDDIRTPIIPPDEEKKLRSFLETLDLVKPDTEYEDNDDDDDDDDDSHTKEEIVVYRHCTRRSSAEPCYIPPPHRHYLDVITEENSDLSDNDRKSDCDKPWENPELIKKNNDIDEIPDDWGDSDQEVEYPSEEDGGIKPWNGCKTLEEVDGVEIVYLDSDNSDETIIEDNSNKESDKNEAKLVVCKTREMEERQKIDTTTIINAVVFDDNIEIEDKENLEGGQTTDQNSNSVVSENIKIGNKNGRDIVDENPISRVVVKENELQVDKKTQIYLINTVPKSSELVMSCGNKLDNGKYDARKMFFSNETFTEKNFDEEVVDSTISKESIAVSKISTDQSVGVFHKKDGVGIESLRRNTNTDSNYPQGRSLNESGAFNKDNGRNESMAQNTKTNCKSVEGKNFDESGGFFNKDSVGIEYITQNTDTKSVKGRNLNNNLETLDLIKVCAKSGGEDRSDLENIYEYIEFRQESVDGIASKIREDIIEIDSDNKNSDKIPKPQVKVDVTATPILSRQNSSSSGTMSTQCTSKYNQSPTAWSSENEEKHIINDSCKIFEGKNPESLRELSTKKVISLPNGLRLLEDIGIIQFRGCFDGVDRDQNDLFRDEVILSSRCIDSPDITCPPSRPLSVSGSYFHKRHSFSPKSCSILYTPSRSLVNSPPCSLPPDRERWIGIPTASQNTFVCFSPSQTKSTALPPGPQEAAGLLDLHKKFIERRGYHEDRWRDSSSDLQSPDLIRLEQYSAPIKQRDYTPELLAEAANLLALKEYRESRCREGMSPEVKDVDSCGNENENVLKRFQMNEILKMNQGERSSLPSYNPRNDSKFKTKSIGKNAKQFNEFMKIDEAARSRIPSYNLRNDKDSTTKLINEDVGELNEFVKMSQGERSTPISYNSTNDKASTTKLINEDVELLNDLLEELDIDNNIEHDINRTNKLSKHSSQKLNDRGFEVDTSSTNTKQLKHSSRKQDDNRFLDDRNETPKLSKYTIEELVDNRFEDDRSRANKLLKHSKNRDDLYESFQDYWERTTKLLEHLKDKEDDCYENFDWLEGDTNRGVVRNRIAKLENACLKEVGAQEKMDAEAELSVDRSRLLALIQSQKDRSAVSDGELQVDATCNRRDCNEIVGEVDRRRSSGSGEMTRGDDQVRADHRGDDRSDDRRGDSCSRVFDADDYKISKRGDIAVMAAGDNGSTRLRSERPKSLPPGSSGSGTELFRQKMYEEYMEQVAERYERRQQKVIRLSGRPASLQIDADNNRDPTASNEAINLEDEFMVKVRERMSKLGINLDDENNNEEGCGESLPKHLQEFAQLGDASDGDALPTLVEEVDGALSFSRGFLTGKRGVWSPAQTPEAQRKAFDFASAEKEQREDESERDRSPPPVVWTPKTVPSPTVERKSYRPVKFESPPPVRKNPPKSKEDSPKPPTSLPLTPSDWSKQTTNRSPNFQSETSSTTDVEQRLTSSQSADSSLVFSSEINLPRAPNPTITLLQKAREGQLPRGAHYLEGEEETASIASDDRRPHIVPNEIIYTVKKEYCSEGEDKKPTKIVELGPRKFEGIGPTTKEGIPIVLRSEVKDSNQQKWYKRMYDSLHKAEADNQYPYASAGGYLSEPDRLGYDSDLTSSKYATLDRRRIRNKEKDFTTSTMPRSKYVPDNSVKRPAVDVYKNQPGRIEDYEPGRSSISEKEAKQWWDEVLDIFDEQFEQAQNTNRLPPTTPNTGKPLMTYALKESGYESDSTLVFKRRDENLQNQQAMSPAEQRMAYKTIQKGGEVPLHGLRKPAPERPKEPISGGPVPVPERSQLSKRQTESPHRYVESEVTIHYKSPVRAEAKEALSEEELAQRQAETMRRIYQEERRRKYLQELQDMYSRRHTDNFIPSQKSPIPLNRYDDFPNDVGSTLKSRDRTPEPKLVARALYNFVGQSSRELTFRRGDIIYVRRQIDKNWFEGEHNAMIGLFPLNHVEIIPYDGIRTMPKRSSEGQARAKFNFQAQTHLELSLVKGELVVLTRRVDENWFEGRIGNRKGIFPVSYVEVFVEPGERAVSPVRPTTPASSKPVASPASHSMILNGARNALTHHHYTPPPPVSYTSLSRPTKSSKQDLAPVNQALHIDTQSEPVPYRALYNYKPQNDDELELTEGDLVYVMEKCDDGWYVGSSQRTACFGTFPGNYVQRLPRAQF